MESFCFFARSAPSDIDIQGLPYYNLGIQMYTK